MKLKVVVGLTSGEIIEFYEEAQSAISFKTSLLNSIRENPWYNYNFESDTGIGWFNVNSVISLKIYDKL